MFDKKTEKKLAALEKAFSIDPGKPLDAQFAALMKGVEARDTIIKAGRGMKIDIKKETK